MCERPSVSIPPAAAAAIINSFFVDITPGIGTIDLGHTDMYIVTRPTCGGGEQKMPWSTWTLSSI